MEDSKMVRMIHFPRIVIATAVLSGFGLAVIGAQPAAAAVVCKTAGVPQGCVAVAPVAPVVVAPRAAVVARPGGVGVGVARGVNRGGPVNRVGLR
jgi:hypothetical protein